jgi:predicted metal-binding membrane protein
MPLQVVRSRPSVIAALLAAAGLAWWWTVQRMAGMDGSPGTSLGTLAWFTGSWVLMMMAMMLPSFAPTLAAYVTLTRGRPGGRWVLFACGYLLAWAAAGLLAYGVYELGRALLSGELVWHRGGRWLSIGVLAGAAAYELMPVKRACLTRCRGQLGDPRGVLSESWPSALARGVRSGGWCIGCSWALMATLFALGVMSLTWMAVIAGVVALQKVGPWPLAARLTTGLVLAVLAAMVVVSPHDVPGLAVPGSGTMHAMKAMG